MITISPQQKQHSIFIPGIAPTVFKKGDIVTVNVC